MIIRTVSRNKSPTSIHALLFLFWIITTGGSEKIERGDIARRFITVPQFGSRAISSCRRVVRNQPSRCIPLPPLPPSLYRVATTETFCAVLRHVSRPCAFSPDPVTDATGRSRSRSRGAAYRSRVVNYFFRASRNDATRRARLTERRGARMAVVKFVVTECAAETRLY